MEHSESINHPPLEAPELRETVAADDARLCAKSQRVLKAVEYKNSLVVRWGAVSKQPGQTGIPSKRGNIDGMSAKSSRRLLFVLGNSPGEWGAMATLTFRDVVADGRPALARFQRLIRDAGLRGLSECWVREYQKRGAVHFHYLWERDGLTSLGFLSEPHLREQTRRGKRGVRVVGPLERIIVDSWKRAVADESDDFQRFQDGGIVELLADRQSAARYFASYITKQEQKTLPVGICGLGRWWWASREAKPIPEGNRYVSGWPFKIPFACVFDKEQMKGLYSSEPVEYNPPFLQ